MITTTQDELKAVHTAISEHIHQTPLLTCRALTELTSVKTLHFKCENFQKVGAFKARGGLNAVRQLGDDVSTVCTHSSGNHAQAIAYAAKIYNKKAIIVMPENAPRVKVDAVKNYGAQVLFCAPTQQARQSTADKVVEETGAAFIHPYNNEHVIKGQATASLEIFQSMQPDVIIAPIGGGGLMSGTLLAQQIFHPNCNVYGVEPELCNDAQQSVLTSQLLPPTGNKSIADGLLTSLGTLTFPIIKNGIKQILTVSEQAIKEAQLLIMQRMKIVVEPSSATTLAAIIKYPELFENQSVAVILTGGNIDI